jgi:hypothetical protein
MQIKVPVKISLLILFSFYTFLSVAQTKEKDPLNKRKFNISLGEVKDGAPQKKVQPDKIEFKNGRIFSDFINQKFGFKWIKYRIERDSIYTDSTDTEVRFLAVEATATDEGNQTIIISFNTVEWDIEGTVKITKNDKLKKYFDFVGREKGGKPKKNKKKDPKDKMRMEGEEAPKPKKE